jgi:two-component system, cell cycle sensor histidine kinase and response regulator CckA
MWLGRLLAAVWPLGRARAASAAHGLDRSRAVLDCINDGVFVHDAATGAILEVNAAAERMFGYAGKEWLGLDVATGSADEPAYSQTEALKLIHAAAAGAPQLVEWHSRRRDGTLFWSEVNLRGARIDGAERVLVVVRDISERKRAEESLRREQALTERVVDAIPGIFFVFDRDGRYVRWNKAHEILFGMPEGRILDTAALSRIHPDDRVRVAATIQQIHSTGTGEVEARGFVGAGPETRHFYLTGRRLDIDGEPYVIGFGIDVTARYEGEAARAHLEEQLRQAQKMEAIGRLAGGVAHDFNNLLTVINGYSDMLIKNLPKDDPQWPAIEEIRDAGERAAALTKQLLTFGRREISRPRPLELNALISGAERMLQRLIGEDILLETSLDPALDLVMADPGQMHQVLLNLSVNARDAMPDGGRLVLATANARIDGENALPGCQPGAYVKLTATDTGTGMDDETMRHLFEPFFTTKPSGLGTGLGLATVYGIVQQGGGSIRVRSEPGKGSCFEIHLPCAEGPAEPVSPLAVEMPQPERDLTVLVVEDQGGVRRLASYALRACGYHVLEAASGDEALRLAEAVEGGCQLVVTDVVMPGMSGKALAEELRARWPEIKVLFMSGYPNDVILRHGLMNDEVNCLEKPFTPSELAAKVREVMG